MTEALRSASPAFDRRAIPSAATETCWKASDGHLLRRIDWLLPRGSCRGSLLFLPGRGDAYEKYLETLDYWHGRGWRVTAADWRGQAGSGRFGHDRATGHIDDFAYWIDDLAELWAAWKQETPAPHVLIGHSMGGHLVLRALAEMRVDPDAAVLSAPMLGFRPGFVPTSLMHWLAKLMVRIGDSRRPAWKWDEKPGVPPAGRSDLLTHDLDRYADELWWREARPELAMGPPSWGWMESALASIRRLNAPGVLERVAVPVLILATKGDGLVDYGAIEQAGKRMAHAELICFGSDVRHEILREVDGVRDKALEQIDDFLDRTAPVTD